MCEPSQELQGKKKKDETKLTENDSIEDEEDRANEQEFAGMNVTKNEALSYERRRKGKTTHNVCFRQIMDDVNR